MESAVFDQRSCELGEGALWHPARAELFWFDIPARRLLSRGAAGARERTLPVRASAAAILGTNRLLLGATGGLLWLDLESGSTGGGAGFPDDGGLVTNDGRADPWGGFWISRMAPDETRGAGEIWRWRQGRFRRVAAGLTIPNAICFDRPRGRAYFADTTRHTVMVQEVDAEGWPKGEASVFLDLSASGAWPDGAVTDASGNLWIALWGAGTVACHDPDGQLIRTEHFSARQVSCPAFGGAHFDTLFVTSAFEGLMNEERARDPFAGMTFVRRLNEANRTAQGRAEPVLRLDGSGHSG
ncbi:MAG: hypothetical protein BGO05_21950 [Rhizobiales bacterium 63-7]|nr:MAG: hypothetical protein BGO05_21950 [Rhizobiales bacterium 63-7]